MGSQHSSENVYCYYNLTRVLLQFFFFLLYLLMMMVKISTSFKGGGSKKAANYVRFRFELNMVMMTTDEDNDDEHEQAGGGSCEEKKLRKGAVLVFNKIYLTIHLPHPNEKQIISIQTHLKYVISLFQTRSIGRGRHTIHQIRSNKFVTQFLDNFPEYFFINCLGVLLVSFFSC